MNPELVKSLIKPPFATYDIVVYFGAGLFSLPILQHYYIKPFGLHLPEFQFISTVPFADAAVVSLCFLFSVYILGHAIAYFAGQLIEKSVDMAFGKMSSVVLWSSLSNADSRNRRIRELIRFRLHAAFTKGSILPYLIRAIFHAPALPIYFLIYVLGIFGYISSRIPSEVFEKARTLVVERNLGDIHIAANSVWYKQVEHYVINRNPGAIPRMYNYLIISGLFRSLSFIMLITIWLQIFYDTHYLFTGHRHTAIFMANDGGVLSVVNFYLVVASAFFFCIFSHIKFQRRYVEETIFAFTFGE